jgi:hypothetical protein
MSVRYVIKSLFGTINHLCFLWIISMGVVGTIEKKIYDFYVQTVTHKPTRLVDVTSASNPTAEIQRLDR